MRRCALALPTPAMRPVLPVLLMSACMFTGCASVLTKGPDDALFPHDAAPPTCTSTQPGRARLLLPERVLTGLSEPLAGQRLQVGQISAQALLRALKECLTGGGLLVDETTPAAADGAATLSIESLRYEHQDHILWFVPIPFLLPMAIGESEIRATLDLEFKLLDEQGRTVWTRSYSDANGRLKHSSFEPRALSEAVPRLAHEAAWRLAQRVVRDLREWIDAQRLAPRDL